MTCKISSLPSINDIHAMQLKYVSYFIVIPYSPSFVFFFPSFIEVFLYL
ncbi:hypothetical protein OIU79_001019 [Salix purpurea]|uniref:Uncharacterized protein n=1 Tax=Salix purpurea TaxID=77065 RepID=A0A9Q0ZNK7_SALPP|nr:hypothetical protein OIU79_001019 [Salix purpurea]